MMSPSSLLDEVRSKYSAAASSPLSGSQAGVRSVAEAFGYTPDQLASIPDDAHLGLSCGNPTATSYLRPGEVVVDLGCGAGIDVFLAALKVGPTGKAIGVDMTAEMIARANASAIQFGQGAMPSNVEFRLGRIESLPLEDSSADCLISNCVINLVPDKRAAFREMFRVLKPGGRVALSDIALKRAIPEELAQSVAAHVGCIAGAIPIDEYQQLLWEAGFADVQVVDSRKDLNAYAKIENASGCCGPGTACGGSASQNPAFIRDLVEILARHDVNEYAASVQVYALKSEVTTDNPTLQEKPMTVLEIFDRPLCCSTGICGPSVDPALVHFAADLDWLGGRGVEVRRHNLAFEPAAFTRHPDVVEALRVGQVACLPLVRVDGQIVSQGRYPGRDELASWCGVERSAESSPASTGNCCSPSCCS